MKQMICMMLALTMLLCAPAMAQEPGVAAITVQGNGSVTATPDIVTVTVSASMTAGTMLDAQKQVGAVVESATAKLLELGVLPEDLVTTGYSYNPRYNYDDDTRRLIGYEASHTLEITCRDVEMLDSVIGAVTDSGMTDIYSVSYGVADRSALYMQALDLAIQSAKEKADAMAAAGGMKITGLESLSENQSYDARYVLKSTAAQEDAAAVNTGIRAGGISVSAGVTAVYRAQ